MTIKEILVAAKKIIAKKKNWHGGDKKASKTLDSYCASTAVWHHTIDIDFGNRWSALLALHKAANLPLEQSLSILWNWNDSHTHKQVLALFDRAIKATK